MRKKSGVKRDCCCDLFYFYTKTNVKKLGLWEICWVGAWPQKSRLLRSVLRTFVFGCFFYHTLICYYPLAGLINSVVKASLPRAIMLD